MKSAVGGRRNSPVEVTNLSIHELWIPIEVQELFAPFNEFLWFTRRVNR